MFYLWRWIWQGKRKRKRKRRARGYSRTRPSSYSPKYRAYPTVTAVVEIIGQTEKALRIKNDRGETAWISKVWVLKQKEFADRTVQIEIKKYQWEEKFPEKPKQRLSPRSRH